MRYIDSGSRSPLDALGTWLGSELLGAAPPIALRVQTGFFGPAALGYFGDALANLGGADGHTRLLIGSNDGQTSREAIADLLTVAGQPRIGMRIGVVSYQAGYFHPKVVHIERNDGSSTAYVGSANLTGSGVASLHIEAGILLDSNSGDAIEVLDSIANAIDDWFSASRPGLYIVSTSADITPLVEANILDFQQARTPRAVKVMGQDGGDLTSNGPSLHTLITIPPKQTQLPSTATDPAGTTVGSSPKSPVIANFSTPSQFVTSPAPSELIKKWGKILSSSDAGRKPGPGANERGSIPLSQGDLRGQIDQTTYFRNSLFGQLVWTTDETRTHKPIEATRVFMHVTINEKYYGRRNFKISNEPGRLQERRNLPTAHLHVDPISHILKEVDVQGMNMEITLDIHGDYRLTIA